MARWTVSVCPSGAHEHEAAVGRDLPQPCAQGQTIAHVLPAVLSHLQQRPGGQVAADGHVRVGIVRLVAQLEAGCVPYLGHQALGQRRPPHDEQHCFQSPHLPA